MAVSDVPGDDLSVIGSGIGDTARLRERRSGLAVSTRIVASNAVARDTVAAAARERRLPVCCNEPSLHAELGALVMHLADQLEAGPSGLYICGGEPTVVLPPEPGQGGRNQSLGLALWAELCARAKSHRTLRIDLLVAGTDGSDGPTAAAGAQLTASADVAPARVTAANAAVLAADAGRFLAAEDGLFVTGPTGTNVMDIALCLKH